MEFSSTKNQTHKGNSTLYQDMKVNGKMTNTTDMVKKLGMMVVPMQESILTEKKKDQAIMSGPMETHIRDIGQTIKSLLIQVITLESMNGVMENFIVESGTII